VQPIRVAYTADDYYVAPMVASMRSLISHKASDDVIEFAILSCGMKARSRSGVQRLLDREGVNVHWANVDPTLLEGMPTAANGAAQITSPAVYARLYLPRLLPADWHKVLYLDPDTLVLHSLRELWDVDTAEFALAAVQEYGCPYISSEFGVRNWKELGIDPEASYFNSGVMLIDLMKWRQTRLGDRAIAYAKANFGVIFLYDQEALNALVQGRYQPLDPLWNVTSYWRKPERQIGPGVGILEKAKIRHFTGPFKPWWPNGLRQPHARQFFEYLKDTEWSDWRGAGDHSSRE
jgi:lipopolysaccharide biosynthesis glycosyltransferase